MRPLHLASIFGLALVALAGARPCAAQPDTLVTGASALGLPVIASLVLDDLAPCCGQVHIAFTQNQALKHAWKAPGPWTIEPVADSARAYDIGVRADGLASIAFSDFSNRLIYASRGPSGWTLDTLGTYPAPIGFVSLALSGEQPAIAWLEQPAGSTTLRYARRNGGAWNTVNVATEAF
jgi:hypothetical protein